MNNKPDIALLDFTSYIVHIGKPSAKFLRMPKNATILVVSEGSVQEHLINVQTNNTILVLESGRYIINGI